MTENQGDGEGYIYGKFPDVPNLTRVIPDVPNPDKIFSDVPQIKLVHSSGRQ